MLCSDGVLLGVVDADEGTHLRVEAPGRHGYLWVPKFVIADVDEDGVAHLWLPRDDLHDGVIALPPARQREFGTLEGISLLVRRAKQRPLPQPLP